jgi:membrane protein implicated in regulation of membrane protease activity
MENSTLWAVVWFAAAATLGVGEILVAGSFFLVPFAIGAVAAAIAALFTNLLVSWIVFLVVSVAAFFGLRPYSRRLEEGTPNVAGIGANRLVGMDGVVLMPIPSTPGGAGLVRVGTEEWRADSEGGVALAEGQTIEVVEVQGTRLLVKPITTPFKR